MKCLALLLGCMFSESIGQAQSYEPALGKAFAWDYPDHLVREFGVVRFEIRIDGGTPSSAGMSTLPGEFESYSMPLPVMPIGQHVAELRACSSTACGGWSEPMLFVFSPPFVVEFQRRFGWPSPYHEP